MNHFANMSRRDKKDTREPVNSITISNDEQLAIVVSQDEQANHMIYVNTYDLNHDELVNEEIEFTITGPKVIKAHSIIQTQNGEVFALPYFNSGMYMLRVFDRQNICLDDFVNINEKLGISKKQRYVNDFDFPSITANFMDNETLFISLYDNNEINHHSFYYNYKEKTIGKTLKRNLANFSNKNFIMRCLKDD